VGALAPETIWRNQAKPNCPARLPERTSPVSCLTGRLVECTATAMIALTPCIQAILSTRSCRWRHRSQVKTQVTGIIAGLVLGVSWTCLVAAFLYQTRSSRMARNQHVIRLGQILVGGLAVGSLLLLAKLSQRVGLASHTSAHYLSLYAFAFSSSCVIFFTARAEIRWRKSSHFGERNNATRRQPLGPVKRGYRTNEIDPKAHVQLLDYSGV